MTPAVRKPPIDDVRAGRPKSGTAQASFENGRNNPTLRGNPSGFHSIRINDQWRIVFRWTKDGPAQVAILDYH